MVGLRDVPFLQMACGAGSPGACGSGRTPLPAHQSPGPVASEMKWGLKLIACAPVEPLHSSQLVSQPLLNQKHAWPFFSVRLCSFCPAASALGLGHQNWNGIGNAGTDRFHGSVSASIAWRGGGIVTAPCGVTSTTRFSCASTSIARLIAFAPALLRDGDRRRSRTWAPMRPRLREQGYLGVLAEHSAGRRPAVSSTRVCRAAACGVSRASRAPLRKSSLTDPSARRTPTPSGPAGS
eukprot:COSAG04_NODE_4393_length_2123_cov_1.709980_2_plen_237_part_00